MDTRQMTLRQLRDRLTAIIEENDARGWSDRNDKPVCVQVHQTKTPSGRTRKSRFLPIAWAPDSLMGIHAKDGTRVDVIAVDAYDDAQINDA